MPHLDLTYCLNQSLWCIFTFSLIYFTAGQHFFNKFNKALNDRKEIVNCYIHSSKKILTKAQQIETQINNSKQWLNAQLREEERQFKVEILNMKNDRLNLLKKEIANKNLEHQLFLNKMKINLIQDFNQHSNKVQEKINEYFFST